MAQIFKNNITGTLAAQLNAGATTCTLYTGHTFTDPGSDWYLATLVGVTGTTETSWEIVRVTDVSTNTLTITRAQESTADATWPVGTRIEARLTAGATESKANLGAAAYKAVGTGSGDVAAGNRGVTNGDSHDHNGGDGAQIAYSSLSGLPTLGTAAATASTDYAPAAKGVTNGDSHNHNGGDGAQIAYSSLSGLPTLGTAASKDVGTGSGQVSAGDHAHASTYQPLDADLTALAGLSTTGLIERTGAGTAGIVSVTTAGKAILDDADAAAQRTTLSVQETLTAARTYYVRTDGSDSNTGLANTSGGAFLTIGHAMDVARSINLSIYDITIAVGAGTFAESLLPAPYVTGGGIIKVQGTAGSTTISMADGNCIEGAGYCTWFFLDLILTNSDGGGVEANDNITIILENVTFGAIISTAVAARSGGRVFLDGDITITGNCGEFFSAYRNGAIYNVGNSTTLSGTRAFTTFAKAETASYIQYEGSFTGSATGKRYSVTGNSVINTFGAGATYLPGDVAGTTATGGQYL